MPYRFFIKEGTNKYLKVTDVDGDESRQLFSHLGKYWVSRVVPIIIFALLIDIFKMEYNFDFGNEIIFF